MNEQWWDQAYQNRVARLKKLIELRAPRFIIYAECRLLLQTQYRGVWGQLFHWAWDVLLYQARWCWESIQIRWTMTVRRMSREEAINYVFGDDE